MEKQKKQTFSRKIKAAVIVPVIAVLAVAAIGVMNADNVPPEINILKQSAELGEPVNINELIGVSDNKDTSPNVSISNIPPEAEVNGENIIFHNVGIFELQATAVDKKANHSVKDFSIDVNDSKSPVFDNTVISLAEYGTTVQLASSKNVSNSIYVHAADASDITYKILSVLPAESSLGSDSYKIIDDNNVTFNKIGKYNVNIAASDEYGNTSEGTTEVNVIDKTGPVISKSRNSFSLTAGSKAPDYKSYVSANDEISGTCSIFVDDSNVNYDEPGT